MVADHTLATVAQVQEIYSGCNTLADNLYNQPNNFELASDSSDSSDSLEFSCSNKHLFDCGSFGIDLDFDFDSQYSVGLAYSGKEFEAGESIRRV